MYSLMTWMSTSLKNVNTRKFLLVTGVPRTYMYSYLDVKCIERVSFCSSQIRRLREEVEQLKVKVQQQEQEVAVSLMCLCYYQPSWFMNGSVCLQVG